MNNDEPIIRERKWITKEEAKEMFPESIEHVRIDLHDEIEKINYLISKVEQLNEKCEDNMKRLNSMMLELKGIISMVRPMAKKNDWYKDEIVVKDEYSLISLVKELPINDTSKD